MNKNSATYKLVSSGLIAALICGFTLIKFSLAQGYFNFGDSIIFTAAFLMPDALYFTAAAGVGSALADLVSGYPLYIPVTFIIKAAVAFVAFYAVNKTNTIFSRILMLAVAALLIPIGYFIYELILYGFGTASVDALWNTAQGAMGAITGGILGGILRKRIIKQA